MIVNDPYKVKILTNSLDTLSKTKMGHICNDISEIRAQKHASSSIVLDDV